MAAQGDRIEERAHSARKLAMKAGALCLNKRAALIADDITAKGKTDPVSCVGISYDNALTETINGFHKAELIHRRGPWRSFKAVESATLIPVDWFNNRRRRLPIGNIPPAEA